MNIIFKRKAQNLIEYSIILAIVGVAISSMAVYMRRCVQGVIKIASDELGPQQVKIKSKKVESSTSETKESKTGDISIRGTQGGGFTKNINLISEVDTVSHSKIIEDNRQGGN